MYLLVFVTLMIGILGTYIQVAGLQASRFASGQSGIGSAMLQWHAAAISMAVSIIKTNGPTAPNNFYPGGANGPGVTGCSLTYNVPPGTSLTQCQAPILALGTDSTGTVTTGPGTPVTLNMIRRNTSSLNECVYLSAVCTTTPADPVYGCHVGQCATTYNIANHQFYSVLYKDQVSKQDFVVTFLPAPVITAANPAPGFLSFVPVPTTATPLSLGLSASDLLLQLNNANQPNNNSFGSFSNVSGSTVLAAAGINYTMPSGMQTLCSAGGCIANGSVAVISSPDGF